MTKRSLHLIDIENLAGTGHLDHVLARRMAAAYYTAAECLVPDLEIVACSHHSGFAVALAFCGASIRWRSGPDGADLALLEAADELPFECFDRLVIGSGDGIFLRLARQARANGLIVDVVARACGVSWGLARAADRLIPISELELVAA